MAHSHCRLEAVQHTPERDRLWFAQRHSAGADGAGAQCQWKPGFSLQGFDDVGERPVFEIEPDAGRAKEPLPG